MRELALVTHSTSPRGGMVHTLALAEALQDAGTPVHVLTQGDPAAGLHRATTVPHTVLPAPPSGGSLTEKVFASVDALAAALDARRGRFDVLHAQDCIAARAAARVRDAGAPVRVVRTVHHVDDFTTPALVDCQRRAIAEPDDVLVVSEHWRAVLARDHGRDATVVPNGVDPARLGPVAAAERRRRRDAIGAGERFVFLAVGGIEPRKGTRHTVEALAALRAEALEAGTAPPLLAIVGGHSFRDYAAYRDDVLAALPGLGLALDRDVVLLGTLPDADVAAWYRCADALAFPSVAEGFGLAVLEAMAAELPVIATDLPVFGEYLVDGRNALLARAGDPGSLAGAMRALRDDPALRARLAAGGRETVPGFTWARSAEVHRRLYARTPIPARPPG